MPFENAKNDKISLSQLSGFIGSHAKNGPKIFHRQKFQKKQQRR